MPARPSPLRKLLATLSVALVAVVVLFAPASGRAAPVQQVYAGVYLHDVARFDQKDGVFDVDLELWAKWLGDFKPDQLRIANAAETEVTLLGEEADGAWKSTRWRVRGTLRGEFPLQRFPFDRQTLSVILELPESAGNLQPDLAGSGMAERFSVTGWLYEPLFVPRISKGTYRSDLGSIANEGRPTPVQRVAFNVSVHRPLLMAATKLFLPLGVILLVALIALLVHPKWLDVRSGVGVTALLACFAFQFSVADTMPNVSYMTIADMLFLGAYALTAVILCVSVVAAYFHDRNMVKAWRWLDIVSLTVIPIVVAVVTLLAVREPARAATAKPPPPAGDRPPSARDVLRIGINALENAGGGLIGRGVNWGTVRKELDGTRVPVLVEAAPSITNDSLRFLADGKLEVTWHLRDGVKWSDGKPLTVDDLRFALEVSPDPNIIESHVLSPRELMIRYRERVATALESITPLPRHALEAEFKKGGFEAVREYRRTHIVPSAGPYRLREFKTNELAVLEPNPHFIGRPPSIKRIEIRRFPNDAALVAAFEAGQLDFIAPNAISPETAQSLAERRPEAVKIRPSDVILFLHADLSVPMLANLDVRRGLLAAFDRERLRMEVFGEAARVAHIPVPGPLPDGSVSIPYDPAAARKAFTQAGVLGQRIRLSHGARPVDRQIAAQLVRDAAAAGITLEPVEVEKIADLYRKRKHGGLLLSSTTGERDALPEKYFSLPQVSGKFDRKFRNAAYDDAAEALVEREEHALYTERREQIRDLLFARFSQKLPSLPLVFLADAVVSVPDLRGWTEGTGTNFGTTLERWHFAKPQ